MSTTTDARDPSVGEASPAPTPIPTPSNPAVTGTAIWDPSASTLRASARPPNAPEASPSHPPPEVARPGCQVASESVGARAPNRRP